MNELIEKLWGKYRTVSYEYGELMDKDNFSKAIALACKAQRNACARACLEHNRTELIPNTLQRVNEIVRNERTIGVIMRSEITEADYE